MRPGARVPHAGVDRSNTNVAGGVSVDSERESVLYRRFDGKKEEGEEEEEEEECDWLMVVLRATLRCRPSTGCCAIWPPRRSSSRPRRPPPSPCTTSYACSTGRPAAGRGTREPRPLPIRRSRCPTDTYPPPRCPAAPGTRSCGTTNAVSDSRASPSRATSRVASPLRASDKNASAGDHGRAPERATRPGSRCQAGDAYKNFR